LLPSSSSQQNKDKRKWRHYYHRLLRNKTKIEKIEKEEKGRSLPSTLSFCH
jgi:hypothetical protein